MNCACGCKGLWALAAAGIVGGAVVGAAVWERAGSTPASTPAVTPVALNAEDTKPFEIDTVHSSVVYRIKHQDVAYFYGTFNDVSGTFFLNPAEPNKSVIDVTIKVDSIDSRNDKRDAHLKNQDFFSATEFPTATFKSTGFSRTGESTWDVTGDLTIRGQTKPVTVQVTHTGQATGRRGEVAGIEAKFTFKRSDFGMNYMVGKGLGDEVTIMAGLEGGR